MLKLFHRILALSGKYRRRIQCAFIFSVLKAMLAKVPLMAAFLALEHFYHGTMSEQICLKLGLLIAGGVILEAFAQLMSDRLQSAAGYMMFADKRLELGGHLRRLPMGCFTAGNMGKISSVLSTDMVFIEESAMSTLANMMSYLLSAVLMVLFLAFLDLRIGGLAAVVSLIASLAAQKMNEFSLRESAVRQEQSENLTEAVLAFVEGIAIIKSYNLLGEKSQELSENFRRTKDTAIAFEEGLTPWQKGLNVLYAVGMTGILGLAVYFHQTGSLELPALLGILLIVFEVFGPLKALYGESTRLTVMNSCLDRMEEVFATEELPDQGSRAIPAADGGEEIVFDHVSFAYDEKETIHDISFAMKPHTVTALVGPSGGGKSTIASLIARLWDVKEGKILYHGVDIRDVPLADLMDRISMVFQRVYLFQDTIYNNIKIGRPDAAREEVMEAARKARCYDFIMELPDGFETVVGEGGATLSGGEKQRISIARCILKDAPVIILDEATASVDADNERYIQEAISELVKGKTLLMIAHRLNTIRGADQILVVADGRIAERGTHEELAAAGGLYAEFVQIRKRQKQGGLAI